MYRRLVRSSNNRMLAGVAGGLGDYFNIDPTIIRLIFVALAFLTAILPMIIIYIIAAIVIPDERGAS